MIMRKFIYVLVSAIISYLICVYQYDEWNFIVGLSPSQVSARIAACSLYAVIWHEFLKAINLFNY